MSSAGLQLQWTCHAGQGSIFATATMAELPSMSTRIHLKTHICSTASSRYALPSASSYCALEIDVPITLPSYHHSMIPQPTFLNYSKHLFPCKHKSICPEIKTAERRTDEWEDLESATQGRAAAQQSWRRCVASHHTRCQRWPGEWQQCEGCRAVEQRNACTHLAEQTHDTSTCRPALLQAHVPCLMYQDAGLALVASEWDNGKTGL